MTQGGPAFDNHGYIFVDLYLAVILNRVVLAAEKPELRCICKAPGKCCYLKYIYIYFNVFLLTCLCR